MALRILIYEDNPDMSLGLSTLIKMTDGYELAGIFSNCDHVEVQLNTLNPDVILMDIEMPGTNGIEGIQRIRAINSDVKIIVLTVFDDNQHVFDAVCKGASGYLLKKTSAHKIFEAIDEVMRGGAPMSGSIASKVLRLLSNTNTSVATSIDYELTEREKEILQSLMKGNSYKMIANDLGISIDTVKTHIKRIYTKLQVHSESEAVMKAYKNRII